MKFGYYDVVALIAVIACGGVAFGISDRVSWIGLILCFAILSAHLISLFVTKGIRRAKAIGFLIPTVLIALLVVFASDYEMRSGKGILPQSMLLQTLIQKKVESEYSRGRQATHEKINQRSAKLMLTGHLVVATVLGLLGAAYSESVYLASRDPQLPA